MTPEQQRALRWWLGDLPDDPQHLAFLDSEPYLLRVPGDGECRQCGRPFGEHERLRVRGFETFYLGCGGALLKT